MAHPEKSSHAGSAFSIDSDANTVIAFKPTVRAAEEQPCEFPRYQLIEKLGSGGFGIVWRALQTQPIRREVALKVIKPGLDSSEIIARFEGERQALALMDHPNIAGVLDAGETAEGRPFFVMELIQGDSITEYCDSRKLGIRQRLELFISVCNAVQHAHQKSILHRDLKPSNILMAEVDGKPSPKIIDFGIAKALGVSVPEVERAVSARTVEGMIVGTPQYMSPEQAGAAPDIDTRSDVYALGIILFELLTGDPPLPWDMLRKKGFDEMLRLVREHNPKRPSSCLIPPTERVFKTSACRKADPARLSRLLKGDLDWITLKALEKERDSRYVSASALAADLSRYLNGDPVEAAAPSTAYRLRKLIARHRLAFASAASMALLLIAGISASTWQAMRANKSEAQAKELSLRAIDAEKRIRLQIEDAARAERALALGHIVRGELADGFARLARAVSYQPDSPFPPEMALAALSSRNGLKKPFYVLPAEVFKTGHYPNNAVFSPNGRNIVTAGSLMSVWDVASGAKSHSIGLQNERYFDALFGPEGDFIVTVSGRKGPGVWNVSTGKERVLFPKEWPDNRANAPHVSISPDGRHFATVCEDQSARIWSVEKGGSPVVLEGHSMLVTSARFSPDSSLVATASNDGTAKIWSVNSGRLVQTLQAGGGRLNDLNFSPDGRLLVAAAGSNVAIWDLEAGTLQHSLIGHENHVSGTLFSPDGHRVLSFSWDKTAREWDAHTGTLLATFRGHDEKITCAQYGMGGRCILTASIDRTARLWASVTGSLLATCHGHHRTVTSARFNADDRKIVTSSEDGTAMLWANPIKEEFFWPAAGMLAARYSPDGKRVAAIDPGASTLTVWDAMNKKVASQIRNIGGKVLHLRFNPDGNRIVTASTDNMLRTWDAGTGRLLSNFKAHAAPATDVDVSPDGKLIISAADEGTAMVWDAMTGQLQCKLSLLGRLSIISARFSPDGKTIATGTKGGTANIWDAASGGHLFLLQNPSSGGEQVMFSRDGQRVVTFGRCLAPGVWDAKSGSLLFTLAGHEHAVQSVQYSFDGLLIATAAHDGTARLWDAASGKPLRIFRSHQRELVCAGFSPDGKRLATASVDESLRIWDVASGEQVADLAGNCFPLCCPQFSRDGREILPSESTLSYPGACWNVFSDAKASPSWFIDFLHFIAQKRLNSLGTLEQLNTDEWLQLREKLRAAARDADQSDNDLLKVLKQWVSQ